MVRSALISSSFLAFGISALHGQNLYMAGKSQNYLQTSGSGAVSIGYQLGAQAATATTLKLPDNSTVSLPYNTNDQSYKTTTFFSVKTDLDTAFPNGTYQMTGSGIPTLSFNLTSDTYPTATPSVISGGTWTNGVLILNPAVSNTITISINSSYAALGSLGHMQIAVQGTFDSVNLKNEVVSQSAFGMTVTATPITTITIPAGTLTAGKLYEGRVNFDTVVTLDMSSIPGGGAVSLWSHNLGFYIGASSTVPAPTIGTQPISRTGTIGGSAKFTSTFNVSGAAQNNTIADWWFNGQRINIDGVKYVADYNTGTLTINTLTTADFGNYALRVINSGGLVTSNTATLTQATNYLSNVSVRTTLAPSQTVIVGFVVDGGAKPILVRAAGPTLTTLGVGLTGVTDPSLTLYNTTNPTPTVDGQNNDWSSSLSTAFTTLGAFPFVSGSKDAALLQTINGPHTVNVVSTDTGTVLVESYDAGPSDFRVMTNLSARFQVGTGNDILIAGFVLAGTGNRQLLLRGVGPTLTGYGVKDVLADPQIAVFDGSTQIATNNDWSPSLSSTFTAVGAFALDNASKDAALVVTLPAGSSHTYTVQVSGVGNTTGQALVEVYSIP